MSFALVSSFHLGFKYKHTSFYCALFYCVLQVLRFLQMEGKALYQQNNHESLYCDTICYVMVAWNQTRNISEVCLSQLPTLVSS